MRNAESIVGMATADEGGGADMMFSCAGHGGFSTVERWAKPSTSVAEPRGRSAPGHMEMEEDES